MISEPLESLTEGFLGIDSPSEESFDTLDRDRIFDRKGDTLINTWFLCLVLSGQFEQPTFIYDGEEVTVINEGYLMLLEDEYREEIAKPEIDPAELYKIFLLLI